MIAHILKRFDLVAVQEINDDYRQFTEIVKSMGSEFDFIMSDTAGATTDGDINVKDSLESLRPGHAFMTFGL